MAKGAGTLAVGRYVVAALGWASSVVLVRVFSPEVWGEYSLIFGIMGLIGSFADLQLGRTVMRDFRAAGDQINETLGAFVTLRLGVGVATYVAALAVVWIGRYPGIVLAAMAVSGTVLIVAAAGSAMYVYLTSQMWMRAVAVAGALAQATQLIVTLALALAGYRDLVIFTLPAVVFEFVYLGWQLRTVRGVVRLGLRFNRARWGAWLKEAAVLTIGTALGSVYMRIDMVMLSKLVDIPAVGVYAVGSKFAALAGAIPGAVSASLLVSMTKTWPDAEVFVAAFRRALLLLLVAGTAVALEFGAFAAPIVRLLYGQHYVVGAPAATGLVLAEVLTFFSDLCFVALVAMGRNLPYVLAAGAGAVANVAVNLVLIARWSYNGASVATLITEALVLLILAGVLWRKGPAGEWLPRRGMVKVGVAGAAMAAVAFSLRGHVPWELAAAGAASVFLLVLHVTRVGGPGGLRVLAQ